MMNLAVQRRGVATVIVLAMVFVLGAFAFAVALMSRGATREVDVLGDHLRALAVGEAAFAQNLARLESKPWSQRWFASGPDLQRGISAAGGTYDAIVRDVPGLPATDLLALNQADLLVKATHGRSTVVLYWRLVCPGHSLDVFARVVPTFFTHLPDDTPVRLNSVDPITQLVNTQIGKRAANRPRFNAQRNRVRGPLTAVQIATNLSANLAGSPVDAVTYPGEPARANEPYLQAALPSGPGAVTVPVPSAPPPVAGPPTGPPIPTVTPATVPTGLPPNLVVDGNNNYRQLCRFVCAFDALGNSSDPTRTIMQNAMDEIIDSRRRFAQATNNTDRANAYNDVVLAVAESGGYVRYGIMVFGGARTRVAACDSLPCDP